MEAGPFGSMQLLAEVGKFLQKEDIVPEQADRKLFKAAPYLVVGTVLLVYLAVPFGPDMWFADLEGGVFYVLAVSSISSLGVLLAGWSSANKYALIGGLRAAGQLIAYELPMVLAVVGVIIQAGTMNLSGIVAAQANGEIFGFSGIGNPYFLTQFVALGIFLIAVQAELGQTPFDMPIAESELVTGYIPSTCSGSCCLHRRVRLGRCLAGGRHLFLRLRCPRPGLTQQQLVQPLRPAAHVD